jgi:hypothetical protein
MLKIGFPDRTGRHSVTRDIQERTPSDRRAFQDRTADVLKNTLRMPRRLLVTLVMRWSQWLGRKRRLPPLLERILRSYSTLNW